MGSSLNLIPAAAETAFAIAADGRPEVEPAIALHCFAISISRAEAAA